MNKPYLLHPWFKSLLPSFMGMSLACVLTFAAASSVAADPQGATETGEQVSLNFNNADIDAVVRAIGKISGKNFIVDPRVKGTLNIVTNRPIPRALTYSILLSALRLQGFAVIEGSGVSKVVPEADAKLHAVPVGKDSAPSKLTGDRIVTEVFQIKHESAAQLVQVVRPLITPNNTVSVYPSNNSLIITDYAENVARIARIIESIDVPQGNAQVLPVMHASAVDLASMLNRLFSEAGAGGDASQRVTILADSRSNNLLLRSENRSRLQAVRSMAAQLDQAGATGTVRVIYLKNADAAKVAQTLRSALSGEAPPTATAAPTQGGAAGAAAAASASGGSGGGLVFADVANNALIVTAPDAVYNGIRGVIEQLDRRPAQVYVEALIAEVSADRVAEYGIQWQTGLPNGSNTTVFGGTNFPTNTNPGILAVAANPATVGSGMNFIVGGGSIEILGQKFLELNLLARFLETDSKTNVLSTPNLLTVDNEEAKIVVGKNLPFVTGSFTSTGGTTPANPFQTIERRDVGLTLKIKPQITEGGSIRLRILQEASAVLDTTGPAGPTTTTRTLESTVIADDGAIIALGGLVEDNYSGSQSKVPLLGDLPLLGGLFRYDNRRRSKTNLLIFLRPRIIRTAEDLKNVSNDRYDYVIGKQQATAVPNKLMRGEDPPPVMPQTFYGTKPEVITLPKMDTPVMNTPVVPPAAPAPSLPTPAAK